MSSWIAPPWLWLFLPLAVLAVLAVWWQHQAWVKSRCLAPRLLWQKMGIKPDTLAESVRLLLLLLGVSLLVVQLAGPRPASDTGQRAQLELGPTVIALDVSKSMGAMDSSINGDVATSRFDAARYLVRSLMGLLSARPASLVVFAGEPLVWCPPTSDGDAVIALLGRTRVGDPGMRQGTDIERALRACLALLGNLGGSVVLVSDGEELTGDASRAAQALGRHGVPVLAVGMGLERGTPLFEPSGGPVLWNEQQVLTAQSSSLLRRLASATNGQYFPSRVTAAPDGQELACVPNAIDLVSHLPSQVRPLSSDQRPAYPLALALLALLADGVIALRRGLLRWRQWPRRAIPFALVVVAGWTGSAASLAQTKPVTGYWNHDAPASPPRTPRQAPARFVPTLKDAAATSTLEAVCRKEPKNGLARYDLGNAYLRAGRMPQADHAYQEAARCLPPGSRELEFALYNLGNVKFGLEDRGAAADLYRGALAIDPSDQDARYNLALCSTPPPRSSVGTGSRLSLVAEQEEANVALRSLELAERSHEADLTNRDPKQGLELSPAQIARNLFKESARTGSDAERDW